MAGFENPVPGVGELAGFVHTESYTHICSKIASSKNLEEVYERLNQYLQRLLALKDDKEREVQRNKHKVTTSSYCLRMNRVSEIAAKVGNLITKYERETPISNWFWQRSSLREEIEKQLEELIELVEEGRSMDFLVDKPPESVLKELDAPQIMRYPTLQSALENILGLLKNNNVKAIGVYGTKGVGKTTIVQNLNNNEEVAKLFNIVIFIRVTTDQTGNDLRQKIAKRLKVDIESLDEELKNKKCLLILDEVLKPINLNQMGLQTNSNGSKVVITYQFPQVCKLSRKRKRKTIRKAHLVR